MSILTGRSSKLKKQDILIPNFKRDMIKFLKQYKQFVLKYELSPDYQLMNIYDQFESSKDQLCKIVSIWRQNKSPYQIWWEYCYKKSKSLVINAFVMLNNRIVKANGIYNINLTIKLFQRYSRQIQRQNSFYTFKINPDSGSMNIVYQALDIFEKLQTQICKPNYIRQVFQQMKEMVISCQKIIQLIGYFNGNSSRFPYEIFQTPNSKNKTEMTVIPPIQFLKSINTCILEVDPNCPEQFQNFGSTSSRIGYLKKHSIPIQESVMKIIQILKGEANFYERHENVEIFQVLQNIFQSSYANSIHRQQDILMKRIKILVDEEKINWKPFAMGGFGFLQMAFVKYELSDYRGRNPKIYQGQIARKCDIKTSKVSRQKYIFNLFRNQYNANIMPHYLPVQKQYENYIFSKFQPNSSLQNFIKANRLTLNLEIIMKLMEHAVKGLLFLKQKNIVHLDIKPNNIIVSRDLKAKISDFGEAYSNQQKIPNSSPAFTVPYSPMQIFGPTPIYTTKADVYAIGVSLFKVVFGTHLWGQILDNQKFKYELKTKKLRVVKLSPQKIYKFGIPEVLGPIVHLSLKCINPRLQQRPSLFYISVILSFCRFYLLSIGEGGYEME